MKKHLSFFFLFLISHFFSAQNFFKNKNTGYNSYELILIDNELNSADIMFHTNVKPYRNAAFLQELQDSAYRKILPAKKLTNNLRAQGLSADALFNMQMGYEKYAISEFWFSPKINYHYNNKLYITAESVGSQGNYVSFIDDYINDNRVVPGIGTAYQGKTENFSSHNFLGYVSYSPNKIFNLQAGQDKHFWGDGYRSLFLSDFAPVYPYFKTSTEIWKIKYTTLHTLFKDAVGKNGISKDYKNKYATFHHLSWNIHKRINIALFETIIWQGTDDNRVRGYDINYLNPVIFFRPVEYSVGSSDNALLGFSFKVKAFKKQVLYGQLLLDEFYLKEIKARSGWWANKQGVQLGLRSFDLFKINNLHLRIEGNYVRPYTYSHGSVQQSYGHLNHALAHPLGANFIEGLGIINYRYKKWGGEIKFVQAVYGADSAGYNMGKNIFRTYANRPREYGNYTTQGIKNTLITLGVNLNYMIHLARPMYIEAGLIYRKHQEADVPTQNTGYIYLGLKAPLWNEYRDF